MTALLKNFAAKTKELRNLNAKNLGSEPTRVLRSKIREMDLECYVRSMVILSQALTTAVDSLIAHVTGCVADLQCPCGERIRGQAKCAHQRAAFIKLLQLRKVGFLLGFESLLSCYKGELFMLADFFHGVCMLRNISFALVRCDCICSFLLSCCIQPAFESKF